MGFGRSYVSSSAASPLSGQTIGDYLASVISRQPDAEALVSRHQGARLTYGELGREVERVARGLLGLGIEKGDRVGIWSPTRVEWTLLQFATARVGAILVNINPAYRAGEMAYAVNQSGLRLLVTAPAFKTSDYLARIDEVRSQLPRLERVVVLGERGTSVPGDLRWDEMLAAGGNVKAEDVKEREALLDADDPINIQYTSGTTGSPKGATLTHHNILNNARSLAELLLYTASDRVCIPVPLYHCFGMGVGNLGCVTSGATMVYPAESFEPLATLEAIAEERCTSIYGVPTMFIAQLEHPRFAEFDLTSLRTGIMAGAPCPIEVMKRVINEMHCREITIACGQTETSPVCNMTEVDDPIEVRVGRPGEVCTRGYLVMQGYWENADATAEAVDHAGWMHTGDLGTIDEDGYLNIVGRIKDMVIRGGENLYPVEIEEVLFQHPAVASAQVIGVPDERMGEELMAWVVVREGGLLSEEELKDFCKDRIAHFKVPRYVKFVDEYPMTVTGKVQKFLMRQMAIDELGLQTAAGVKTA